VLEETAKIYESIQNFDRSNETWRKIQEIGPSAGASFELAATRLKLGVPTPAAVESGLPGPSRLDLGTSRTDANGTLEGSNLGITEVTATETPDADAETNLTLRIGVKKRPNAAIDHTKVKIQVYFYDTVDDKDVKLTDAEVTYEWLTPNHDWASSDPEMLAVTYTRQKSNLPSLPHCFAIMQLHIVPDDAEIGEQLVQMVKDLIEAVARRKQQKLAEERRQRA